MKHQNFSGYRTNIYDLALYTERNLTECEWLSPRERIATHVRNMIMVGYTLQQIRQELITRLGHTPAWHPHYIHILHFLRYIGGEK